MLRVTDSGTASPFSAFGGAWNEGSGGLARIRQARSKATRGNLVDAPLLRLRLSCKEGGEILRTGAVALLTSQQLRGTSVKALSDSCEMN